MTLDSEKAHKPDIEYFMGRPYKAFCGACDRIMITGGFRLDEAKELVKECPHCKKAVKWDD